MLITIEIMFMMKKSSFTALLLGTLSGVLFAIGMCMAADLAQMLEKTSPETVSRQEALIRAFGLPTTAEGLSADCVFQAMRGDKKNIGGITRLILPRRIGKAQIAEQVPGEQILAAVRRHCD